jgi:hypothetical protein
MINLLLSLASIVVLKGTFLKLFVSSGSAQGMSERIELTQLPPSNHIFFQEGIYYDPT